MKPNTALITQKMAKKYFGTEHVIGKILSVTSLNKQADFRISRGAQKIFLPIPTGKSKSIYHTKI